MWKVIKKSESMKKELCISTWARFFVNICDGKHHGRKYENCIFALLVTVGNILLMAAWFDFYYDLNDDTMMLDIMSGAYSGVPDGHNMQTLYPLGAMIALCYRLCGKLPWYGLFLCLCQFGCFYLIGVRLCTLVGRNRHFDRAGGGNDKGSDGMRKLAALFALSLFAWGVCLSHLVNIQYTVTAAMLSATAIFLFFTTPETRDGKQFVIKNIPSMALVIVAYQLRSEMLLLTFPFICLAGFYRLTAEKKIFDKGNLFRYGGVLGIMLAGMLLSRGVDYAAYSSGEWKDFLRFFEARTTIYDFYPELIGEESYEDVLTELGAEPYQQALLRNYNYGLDETIDTELLTKLADYATEVLRAQKDWRAIAKKQLTRYCYRTFRGGDAPYSTMLLWLYMAVLAAGFGSRAAWKKQNAVSDREKSGRLAFVWQIVLLAVVRTAIWMFILLRGRDPARITDSLYLVEAALLAAMLFRILRPEMDAGKRRNCAAGLFLLLFLLITGKGVLHNVSALQADQAVRIRVNQNRDAIAAYCKAHEENFYFEDVYSTVAFSRRIYDGTDNAYANYDILGGWMCGSPLYEEKIGRYHMASVQEALLQSGNVFLVMSDAEAAEQGFDWLVDYYDAQGIRILVEKIDAVGEEYAVYQVRNRS